MAAEYFSSLQYIWLNIVFFVFSLFLFAVCLYACLFVRWVYKRRLRQKTDEMIDAYKEEEFRRKETELNLKRQELEYPEIKRKSSSKPRKIHIVTTPCGGNHVIQNNEVIVRQVNENPIEEVPPPPPPPLQHPPRKEDPQMAYLPPQQIQHLQQQQQYGGPQYVLVPVEMMRKKQKKRGRRSSSSSSTSISPPVSRRIDKSVACQTSPPRRLSHEPMELKEKNSEDWLTGFDEKDGERIDVDEEEEEKDVEEMGSEKYMRRKREIEEKQAYDQQYASEETRVSIEDDAPPETPADAPVPTPNSPTTSHSTTPKTPEATSSDKKPSPPGKSYVASQYFGLPGEQAPNNASKPSGFSKDSTGSGSGVASSVPPSKGSSPPVSGKKTSPDKSFVASQYFGQPGEQLNNNSSGKSSSPPGEKTSGSDLASSIPPSKRSSPPGSAKRVSPRKDAVVSEYYELPGDLSDYPQKPPGKVSPPASIFPYFVDPKAPSTSVSTSKASSKLTDPELAPTDSSCALYRQKKKKMTTDSAKAYKGTPPAKTPK
ncbi:hypothetical protein GCK72_000205 [Caenorhabditis remanei]|uniref:Uncharacterized protein n=1 Tax=Caenorhabditis remanei TaxID=31234 RepID=A0A6A5HQ57_CAERE|nr:hypothetical protein GCK72_000205 [Caenorhabditis remanei]KAF1768393.1 hypothetical protein GCK72_000205 [Caenorhabditis remanei]